MFFLFNFSVWFKEMLFWQPSIYRISSIILLGCMKYVVKQLKPRSFSSLNLALCLLERNYRFHWDQLSLSTQLPFRADNTYTIKRVIQLTRLRRQKLLILWGGGWWLVCLVIKNLPYPVRYRIGSCSNLVGVCFAFHPTEVDTVNFKIMHWWSMYFSVSIRLRLS